MSLRDAAQNRILYNGAVGHGHRFPDGPPGLSIDPLVRCDGCRKTLDDICEDAKRKVEKGKTIPRCPNGPPRTWTEADVIPCSTWRHVETKSLYTVVGIANCSTNGREQERSVVYISHTYQGVRYREIGEFLDGRFVRVPPKE